MANNLCKFRNHTHHFCRDAGHVIVTAGYQEGIPNRAGLWTDGRYWLQADQEMDCNWILMKEGNYMTILTNSKNNKII